MALLEPSFRALFCLIVSFLKVFYAVDSYLGFLPISCKVLLDSLSIGRDSFLFAFTIFSVFALILGEGFSFGLSSLYLHFSEKLFFISVIPSIFSFSDFDGGPQLAYDIFYQADYMFPLVHDINVRQWASSVFLSVFSTLMFFDLTLPLDFHFLKAFNFPQLPPSCLPFCSKDLSYF